MKRITVCLLILALTAPVAGQSRSLAEDPRVSEAINLLELWADAQRAYGRIPGISMAVVHDQDLVWSKGFGYADVEKEIPTTPQTIYSICSISKLFTSIAVLQLRDRGLLRLDDPAGKHLSWFDIEQTYPDGPPVTIEGILTHSSGLPRESDFPYWTEARFPTRDQIKERLSRQAMLYPAATYSQYSNLGLTLAGEIVAEVSGRPYAEYVKEHILDPLGLESTTPEIPQAHRGGRLATGYGGFTREGTRPTMPFFQAKGVAAAAGYASTVEDLARFASWQFRLLEIGGTEVLEANTLREMHRVHWMDPGWETTWGLGFTVWRSNDTTFVGHGGSCPGFLSHLAIEPKSKVAAVFMTNAQGLSSRMYTHRAYEILAPAIAEAVKSPDEAKQPDPALEKYTGRYRRGFGGEAAVLTWKGGLAMVGLPSQNPLNGLTKLKSIGEHTFRRIRDDGELGEEIRFEVGEDGQVIRMWRNSQYSTKVQ